MFHENLNRAMVERGISQKQLADITGIAKSGISQYLHGQVIPREDALQKLAGALDVPAQFLTDGNSLGAEVNPAGLKRIRKLTPEHIAKISGKCVQGIRVALQQGIPIYGYALKLSGNRYDYHFYPKKVEECYGSLTGYGYFLEGYHHETV